MKYIDRYPRCGVSVVNGGKPRMLAQHEAVDLHGHDAKPLFQQPDEWQEYLVGYTQPWDEQ